MPNEPVSRPCGETLRGSHANHRYMLEGSIYQCSGGDIQAGPVQLRPKALLPVVVALERRQRAAKRHPLLMPPLPACPMCGVQPAEVIESTGRPMSFEARLLFKPCDHAFTVAEDDAYEATQEARNLVDDEENRPAGERVTAPCPQVRQLEPRNAHNWFAPVDGRARCPGYDAPDGGHAEPAPPQTDAERARDLEHILQRVRETVGTDIVLVSCEEHEVRIAELTTALRDVLAQFVHNGHPGEPCKQTGWVSVRTVQRWQAVLDGEAP